MDQKIKQLEEAITILDTYYYSGDECICPFDIELKDSSLTRDIIQKDTLVLDNEYDSIRRSLYDLCPTSIIFKTVTSSETELSSCKVVHNPPMTSISKANGKLQEKNDILAKWLKYSFDELHYKGTRDSKNRPLYVQSLKRDGVAISLYYEDGVFKKAGLRPRDGINGEDVTENAKHVSGIPLTLPLKITCSIRGELECLKSVFEEINKNAKLKGTQIYANPRNYTAGSIRQFKDPSKTKERRISFTAYGIENLDNPPYETEKERAIWCNTVLKVPFVQVKDFCYEDLKKIEALIDKLDYEIDGSVISVNNLEDQEQLGRYGDRNTGNPRGKLAWKLEEAFATPIVKGVLWQTGRSGKVTPVLQFDPVSLAGTQVKLCTAHNLGIILKGGIGIGAKIKIIKSGKIIPKVIEVVSPIKDIKYPEKCMSCGEPLTRVDTVTKTKKGDITKSELYCHNEKCSAKNIFSLTNYLDKLGIKGIGESKVNELVANGLVKRFCDFYELTVEQMVDNTQLTERQATLILSQIFMVQKPEKIKDNAELMKKITNKITIPLKSFISALGIPGASEGTSKNLVEAFNGDFSLIRNASVATLSNIRDIGDKTANSVYDFLIKNENEINKALQFIDFSKIKTGPLQNTSFCFTGTLCKPRKELESQVEDLGGKISKSVSKNTDYVVAGENAGSKKDKATKLGIKILSESEFETLIGNK